MVLVLTFASSTVPQSSSVIRRYSYINRYNGWTCLARVHSLSHTIRSHRSTFLPTLPIPFPRRPPPLRRPSARSSPRYHSILTTNRRQTTIPFGTSADHLVVPGAMRCGTRDAINNQHISNISLLSHGLFYGHLHSDLASSSRLHGYAGTPEGDSRLIGS